MKQVQKIKEAVKQMKRQVRDFRFELDYLAGGELFEAFLEGREVNEKRVYLETAGSMIWGSLLSLYCEHRGHLWGEEEGYAGPNSGYMGVTCQRCGKHHGERLY